MTLLSITDPGKRLPIVGYTAIFIVVLVWAGFALSIRAIEGSAFAPSDVALIRYGLPAIVLLPFLPSRLSQLRRVSMLDALMIIISAGVPFFFIVSAGGARTSATIVGAIVAGTSPLSVTVLGFLFQKMVPSQSRLIAILVILVGVTFLVAPLALKHPSSMTEGKIGRAHV